MVATPPPARLTRRTLLSAFVAGTAAVPLLSACGGSGGDGKEMSFWNFYGPSDDQGPQSKWFVDLADEWNKNNDVKVKLRYIPGKDYLNGTTLQTAFQSGQGPDIFLISPGDFLRYYNGNVLQDLGSALSPESKADYLPGLLEARSVDGKVYGLPMEIEPLAMYYSEIAFERPACPRLTYRRPGTKPSRSPRNSPARTGTA